MDLDDLHFADDSSSFADDAAFEIILLSDSAEHLPNSIIQSENRLSPCHAFIPFPHKALSNIPEFVETTIVLKKDKNNELGISIAGGSDSYLEQVCVMDVQKKGVAYTDGRLRKGDVVLAVNDVSLRESSLAEATKCLKEAASPVRLIILRENPQALFTTHETPTKFLTVELRKFSITDGIGISIMQRTNGRGVFITYVQLGSIAARHGRRISQGDQILEINGQNVRESNQKDVAHMIQNLDGAIVLLLGRIPKLYNAIQEWVRWKAQQGLRHRTSTWSAYTACTKEKLQVQRPSLPVSKEQALGFANSIITTVVCSPVVPDMPELFSSISPCHSRTSSLRRSRSRLSMVAETINHFTSNANAFDANNAESANSENPLLPSILVTSF